MDYSFLAQDATMTTTVAPSSGFRSFFRPITRLFPSFFPFRPVYPVAPACLPVPVPAGTLGRDANGNLTVNGQTHCYTAPYQGRPYGVPYGNVYFP